MSNSATKTVFWADLSRFGAKLTVAFNPTLERNFLKFTIFDKKLFSSTSGNITGDLYQIMRDAGYAYAPSEIKARYNAAYDAAQRQGLGIDAAEDKAGAELGTLAFYSTSMLIKRELIKQFVPAITETDFRDMAVSEIKHFDFEYMDKNKARVFVEQQQSIRGATPGVFFTIPVDRALVSEAAKATVRINELLAFRDFPPADVVRREALSPAASEIKKFHVIPAIEKLMVGQSLGLDGTPLKAPGISATVIAYPTFEAAVAANDGDVENVERVQYPFGVPLGFEQGSQRLLVLKDVRFLEVPNLLRLQESNEVARNVQMHWDYSVKAFELLAQYERAKTDGLLDMATWSNPATFAKVSTQFVEMLDTMNAASKLTGKKDGFVEHVDLAVNLGVRATSFEPLFPKEFLRFLGDFHTRLYTAMSEQRAVAVAKQIVREGTNAAIAAVKSGKSTAKQAASPAADGTDENGKSRRMDAGEKIGGARKDYASRSLAADEIASLTQRELSELVTKDNVWAPLDYEAMRDRGVEPAVAYLIKGWRSALPTNPLRGGFNARKTALDRRAMGDLTGAMSVNFVRAVSLVRDALTDVKTVGDLQAAMVKIRKDAELPYTIAGQGRNGHMNRYGSDEGYFYDGAGYNFCSRTLPDFTENGDVISSYKFECDLAVARVKTRGGWDWCVRAKSRKDAEVASVGDGVSLATDAAAKQKPQPVFPHLERISRVGADVRGGKDVDEALLLGTFNFRAVEYGNWLQQSERQHVLNHAFDAFFDLANTLGLPPKAMSLGGQLAIAFGARGTGGKGAACAHYESGRNVINLTRLSGAGFLAHEWGHAFDYWLAKETGVSATRPVSEMVTDVKRFGHQPVVNAFTDALNTARTRFLSKEEVIERALLTTSNGKNAKRVGLSAHFRSCMVSWIASCEQQLPAEKRNAAFRTYAVGQLDERIVPASDAPGCITQRFDGADDFVRLVVDALVSEVGPEFNAKRVDARYAVNTANWFERRMKQVEVTVAHYRPELHPTQSHFLQDAEYYDGYRSKAYWSTRVETFARAFETWVHDRVQADGSSCSQYLVYGREDDSTAPYSIFPRAEERKQNAAKFEALFDGCRPALLRYLHLDVPVAERRQEHASVVPN